MVPRVYAGFEVLVDVPSLGEGFCVLLWMLEEIWVLLSVELSLNSGREVFIRKSSLVVKYSFSAFLRAAFESASKERIVLLNWPGSMECLVFGNLLFKKEGISWVGLYLDKSGLALTGGLDGFFRVNVLDCRFDASRLVGVWVEGLVRSVGGLGLLFILV